MDIVDDTLTAALAKHGEKKMQDLISALLARKLRRKGISLSKRQQNRLVTELKNGASTVNFRTDKHQGNFRIRVTDAEVTRIELLYDRWFQRALRKLPKVYGDATKETADDVLKALLRDRKPQLEWLTSKRAKFEKELHKIWKKPLEIYELYISIVEEVTLECYNEFLDKGRPNEISFEILFRLQGRAIQIAKEILVLMKAGFADGAHARWRSLHEIAVVGMFLDENGQAVAERYLAHDVIDVYKGAVLYQKNAKPLKRKVIPKRQMDRYKRERDKAVAKYGTDFKTQYGWASEALKHLKRPPNFADLEAHVRQDKWRHLYKQASWNVHASASGLTYRMGLMDEHQDLILMGESLYGFTDAAHGSSIALMYLSSTIIGQEINSERIIRSLTLMNLSRLIGDEFMTVQDSFVAT